MVSNTRRNVTVRFSIVNQTKAPHFFKEGMKPLVFSEKDCRNIYVSWAAKADRAQISRVPTSSNSVHAQGERIINVALGKGGAVQLKSSLSQAQFLSPGSSEDLPNSYYVLSFTHTFKYDDDRVYFAFSKPYGYSMLQGYLARIEGEKGIKPGPGEDARLDSDKVIYRRELLCRSLGGLPVHVLTVTGPQNCGLDKAKHVVISARVHSSETPGSYKVQGVIDFLLSDSPVAAALRNEFVFLIVPMMNPDGVVLGNNRCSLAGYDLNRCWARPSRLRQPTVYALKKRMRKLVADSSKQISVFCDLHGHSKLLNSFIYACHSANSGSFSSWTQVRMLPRLLAKRCHLLDYHQCKFAVEPAKMSTARVIVWKEFRVANSFTLETSMYAYTLGDEVVRFSEREYFAIGEALMLALNEYRQLLGEPGCRLLELVGTPAADLLRNDRKGREDTKLQQSENKSRAWSLALGQQQRTCEIASPIKKTFERKPQASRSTRSTPVPGRTAGNWNPGVLPRIAALGSSKNGQRAKKSVKVARRQLTLDSIPGAGRREPVLGTEEAAKVPAPMDYYMMKVERRRQLVRLVREEAKNDIDLTMVRLDPIPQPDSATTAIRSFILATKNPRDLIASGKRCCPPPKGTSYLRALCYIDLSFQSEKERRRTHSGKRGGLFGTKGERGNYSTLPVHDGSVDRPQVSEYSQQVFNFVSQTKSRPTNSAIPGKGQNRSYVLDCKSPYSAGGGRGKRAVCPFANDRAKKRV